MCNAEKNKHWEIIKGNYLKGEKIKLKMNNLRNKMGNLHGKVN